MKTRIRVFVEIEAGSNRKSSYDEKTRRYQGSRRVPRPYPYPYGFVLGTRASDGGAVDCYILTRRQLERGKVVDCEAIALMEQFEAGEDDHKVLAILKDEDVRITGEVESKLVEFVRALFHGSADLQIGPFHGKETTADYLTAHRERP